jgi:hypothetical protein
LEKRVTSGGSAFRCAERLRLSDLGVKIVFAAARLSLAAAKKKKRSEPESQRLSAHQAAKPQEVLCLKKRRISKSAFVLTVPTTLTKCSWKGYTSTLKKFPMTAESGMSMATFILFPSFDAMVVTATSK